MVINKVDKPNCRPDEVHDQVFNLDLSNKEKIEIIEKIGECEFRIVEGSSPRIQIGALLAYLALNSDKTKQVNF